MFLGLIRASHPGPTLAVTAVTLILGVAVGLEGLRLALVGLAMLAGQLSIGWSNDWIDVERDRSVKRTDKPVAAGSVSEVAVRNAAVVAVLLMIPLSFAVGFWAGVANIVSVAAGWSYNIWLKRTVFSGVPYVIAFGLLPLFVTQSLPAPLLAAPWAIAAGALLGFAAHFANVLPDLLDDAGQWHRPGQHRGLNHRDSYRPARPALYQGHCSVPAHHQRGPLLLSHEQRGGQHQQRRPGWL